MPESTTIETTDPGAADGRRPSEAMITAVVEAAYILAAVGR
jgi:hypothetical protein